MVGTEGIQLDASAVRIGGKISGRDDASVSTVTCFKELLQLEKRVSRLFKIFEIISARAAAMMKVRDVLTTR